MERRSHPEVEITVAEVNSKLRELPRNSQEKILLRMLSVGVRTTEMTTISDLSQEQIRWKIEKMFPEKEVAPGDIRKLFVATLAQEEVETRILKYLIDHANTETTKALEEAVVAFEKGGENQQ